METWKFNQNRMNLFSIEVHERFSDNKSFYLYSAKNDSVGARAVRM